MQTLNNLRLGYSKIILHNFTLEAKQKQQEITGFEPRSSNFASKHYDHNATALGLILPRYFSANLQINILAKVARSCFSCQVLTHGDKNFAQPKQGCDCQQRSIIGRFSFVLASRPERFWFKGAPLFKILNWYIKCSKLASKGQNKPEPDRDFLLSKLARLIQSLPQAYLIY